MSSQKGKPANAKTAYNFFSSLMHAEFKATHPGKAVDFADFQRRCAAKWKGLSKLEKEPFEVMASLDKQRYQAEIVAMPSPNGKEKKKKKVKDPNEPKRPLSAFFLFSNDKRPDFKTNHPEMSIGEVGKALGQMWRELDADRKREYEGLAKKEKEKYDALMKAYKNGNSPAIDAENVQEQLDSEKTKEQLDDFQMLDNCLAPAHEDDFEKLDDLIQKEDETSAQPQLNNETNEKMEESLAETEGLSDFEKLDRLV